MDNKNFKKGFTLVEAMVLLLGLSIIIAATMPLITKKHALPPRKLPHGQYICTIDSIGPPRTYKEIIYKDKTKISETGGLAACTFKPPAKAAYFVVQAVGGGGGGGYAGAIPTARGSQPQSGSIDVANPSLPSWLSTTNYNTYAGYITMTVPGSRGGKGGDVSAWNGSTFVTRTGGAGGSVSTKTCSNVLQISYNTLQIKTNDPAANGKDGSSDSVADLSSTPGPVATTGWAGQRGRMKLQFGAGSEVSCNQTGTVNGGTQATWNPLANGTPNYVTTQDLDPASYAYPSYSPMTLPWSRTYSTKVWKYGNGGYKGEYSTLFLPALKKNVVITPGAGGAAGTSGHMDGYTGESTSFGTFLSAGGGPGGTGATGSAGPYEVDSTVLAGVLPFDTFYGYYKLGTSGESSVFSEIQILSDLNMASSANSTGYGNGGIGGGTYSRCNSTTNAYVFNGTSISSTPATCLDSDYHGSYTHSYYPGTPARGNNGAVIIVW